MTTEKQREQARLRQQRKRERDRAEREVTAPLPVTVTPESVTVTPVTSVVTLDSQVGTSANLPVPNVTPVTVMPPVTVTVTRNKRDWVAIAARLIAIGLVASAVTVNAWTGFDSAPGIAAKIWAFAAIFAELLSCMLPSLAKRPPTRRERAAVWLAVVVCWGLSGTCVAYFVVTNLAAVDSARAATITPEIQDAMNVRDAALRARDRAGDVVKGCRDYCLTKQKSLDVAQRSLDAAARMAD
jgi:hypothetical protein